ncbi:MAG: 50S ribosomal protein L13 [Candidatus Hodarchaeota archaeon]
MVVYDATDAILGRLSSIIAKRLLAGEEVIVLNVEKAVIAGDPLKILKRYQQRIELKTKTNPRRGPFYPRTPAGILKRAVRGMVPWQNPRGRACMKRLKIYMGEPVAKEEEALKCPFQVQDLVCRHITLGELARRLGGVQVAKGWLKP